MTRYAIRDCLGTIGDFASATEACIFAIQTGIATKWEWVTVNTPAQRDAVRAEMDRRQS